MANTDAWSDFDSLRHSVKNHTVDRLKHILTGLNDECGSSLFKSGKKQELIDRIVAQLDHYRQSNSATNWTKAKAVLYLVRNTGMYHANRMPGGATIQGSSAVPHSTYSATNHPNGYPPTASTPIGRYDAYAPPRRPIASTSVAASSTSGQKPGIRFKSSPFLRIDQAVSIVMECPESTSASDRRQQTVSFTLNGDQLAKLKSTSSKYQLRLYCTSSSFHVSGPNSFRTHTGPCPIEFPPTCEVRVNNVQLTANLKGLKKKPGTAPPADLGKAVRMSNVNSNRIEMIYVNSQQPVQIKKYYLIVNLVEVTSVDEIVEKLRSGKYCSSDTVLARMTGSRNDDDDIVAGPQKMSLKCPLSFVRINTPCRSSQCVHPQCFDATSWFSVMEQTTTWLCPVCEKTLNFEDLVIDGYFDEILKRCPDSVEDVVVEADGEWHTSDSKYASTNWKLYHTAAALIQPSPPRKPLCAVKGSSHTPGQSNGKEKEKASSVEIVVLDSDDEDEGRVKRELSPSFGSGSSSSANQSFDRISVPMTQSQGHIIDLTLDSDSDDEPMSSRVAGKRKATELDVPSHSAPLSKRVCLDDAHSHSMAIRTLTNGHVNGTTSPTSSPTGSAFHSNNAQYASYSGPRSPPQVPAPPPPSTHSSLPSIHIRFDAPQYPPTFPSHPQNSPSAPSSVRSPQAHSPPYSYRQLNGRWL